MRGSDLGAAHDGASPVPKFNRLAVATLWLDIGTAVTWLVLVGTSFLTNKGRNTAVRGSGVSELACCTGILIWLLPTAGLVTGVLALCQSRCYSGEERGRALAVTGIVVGLGTLMLGVLIASGVTVLGH